jgi:predicted phage terminase large subunit-like protein
MHYDWIICDDLHSETNVTNKDQINKVIDHWKLAYSLLDPGRPMIIIGTRWDYNDLYQHILDNERESFNILIRRAINHDGSLFFPQRLTQSFLDDVRRKQGSRIFSAQYLNEPVDDETATFKRANIVHKKWEDVDGRPINWILSVDPSFEGEYSDYAALVVAGMDYQRDLYVRHVTRKKLTYKGIIDEIFRLYSEFHPRTVVLETLGTQKSIMYEMNNEMKRRGTWLPLQEIKQRIKSKEERIRGLAPFYEFGHIYHIKECHQLDDLEYELIHFPRGKHDDVIDALATVLEFVSPASPKQSQIKERDERRRAAYKPRSPITGV